MRYELYYDKDEDTYVIYYNDFYNVRTSHIQMDNIDSLFDYVMIEGVVDYRNTGCYILIHEFDEKMTYEEFRKLFPELFF